MAILCIHVWLHVLLSIQQHMPPLLLPLPPPQSRASAHGLRRNSHNDRHLLLPSHFLHLPLPAPLAIPLSRRDHGNGMFHCVDTSSTASLEGPVQRFSSDAILGDGVLGFVAGYSWHYSELEPAAKIVDSGIRVGHGGFIRDRDSVLCDEGTGEVETRGVRSRRA